MSSIVITIANQKGGTAKTTTAITLACGLADLGYRCILVDCDPQGNVAAFLGLKPSNGLYRLIVQERRIEEVILDMTPHGYPNLGLVTGNNTTTTIEAILHTRRPPFENPTQVLRQALAPLRTQKHGSKPLVIILDTAPSLSQVQVAALNAAKWLIIPASPEFASETGVGALVEEVQVINQTGADLYLLGVLPTLVDARSREHRQTILDLRAAFPTLVLPPVRRLIALAEAPRTGQPIWRYAPKSEAAQDYSLVLKEVIKRVRL